MKIDHDKVLGVVRAFVSGRGGDGARITMETRLLHDGHVDSFALVELIAELEQQLGLDLPMGTLIPEDFETPKVLCARLTEI
ncbi:acyl carrier protein [Myxococcota bacterium]|nr:acyl carrier protein [Myxococcota bacterium]